MSTNKKFFLGVILVPPLMCGLGGLAIFAVSMRQSQDRLKMDEAELGRLGVPLELQALLDKPTAKPDDDAVTIYRILDRSIGEGAPRQNAFQVLSYSQSNAKRTVLQNLSKELDSARRAAQLPTAIFYGRADRLPNKDLDSARRAGILLAHSAISQARSRNYDEAMRDAKLAFAIANQIGSRTFTALLARNEVEILVVDALKVLIQHNVNDSARLRAIDEILTDQTSPTDLRKALLGEYPYSKAKSRGTWAGYATFDSRPFSQPRGPGGPIVEAALAKSFLALARALPSDESDYQGLNRAADAFETSFDGARGSISAQLREISPDVSTQRMSFHVARLTKQTTLATLRLLEMRSAGKALPAGLPPGDWPDSFGKGSLKRTAGPAQVGVYSVGPNGLDQGGPSKRTTHGQDDIGFSVKLK